MNLVADAVVFDAEPGWAARLREASRRDRLAAERETLARERDDEGRRRDREAYRRDRAAADRDREASRRDRLAARRNDSPAAVADRISAAQDRAAAALDRMRAADDRRESALDRHQSALDRWQSTLDRMRSSDDRRAASVERARLSVDDLTGLLRRRTGLRRLQAEIDRATRHGELVTVAFVDVDGLKPVNDRDGHPAGDALLRDVAKALRDCMRSYDVVLRYGGDEFVCGMVSVPEAVAEERFVEVGRRLAPRDASVSVGIAQLRPGETAQQVVNRADEMLVAGRRNRSLAVSGHPTARSREEAAALSSGGQ